MYKQPCDRCECTATVQVKLDGKIVHVFCKDHGRMFVDEIEELGFSKNEERINPNIIKQLCQG